jgi:glycosyltransferase involved in cell wall biosynthesis
VVPLRNRQPSGVTRLTLLTEIPAPYRIPLFNALAERLHLRVVFLRDSNPERPYEGHHDERQFEWHTLGGTELTLRGRWVVLNLGLLRHLHRSDVVVVGGWNQPAFWVAAAWCKLRRVPLVMWVESTGADHRSGRLEPAKKHLLRAADRFIVPGEASRAYLDALGVPASAIAVAPNAVDPEIFSSGRRTRDDACARLIAVGRLAPEKGLDVLIEAVRGLPVELEIAGSGPEEARLRALAGANVRFLGWVARDALPDLYANADVAVMPSRSDPWGLVLNEAALAGLPLVSTTAAGAAWDVIEDGVNGYRVPPGDVAALRAAIVRLVEDEGFSRSAGARSRELARHFTPAAWADAVTSLAATLVRA